MTHPIPFNEASRLRVLQGLDLGSLVPSPALVDVCRQLTQALRVPMVWLSLLDRERTLFHVRLGLGRTEAPRPGSFCAYTILGDMVMEVPDARADSRFADNPLVTGVEAIRFYAGVPLRIEQRTFVGTLSVADREPRVLFDSEVAMLMRAAEAAEDGLRTTYAARMFTAGPGRGVPSREDVAQAMAEDAVEGGSVI